MGIIAQMFWFGKEEFWATDLANQRFNEAVSRVGWVAPGGEGGDRGMTMGFG